MNAHVRGGEEGAGVCGERALAVLTCACVCVCVPCVLMWVGFGCRGWGGGGMLCGCTSPCHPTGESGSCCSTTESALQWLERHREKKCTVKMKLIPGHL
eukprot:365423-Chlamydomonas_euryale.AAC.8